MADVTLWGATYHSVPSIEVPAPNNETAEFYDVTDTTAVASDVASGKYFYTAAGQRTEGTASGGGDAETINALVSGEMGNNSYTFGVTSLGRCFANTVGAFSLTLPNCTEVRTNYALEASELVAFSAPLLTEGKNYMFSECRNLTSVNLPLLTKVSYTMFHRCSSLPKIFFPNIQFDDYACDESGIVVAVAGTTSTKWRQFYKCPNLTTIDLGTQTTKITQVGRESPLFNTLILRTSNACVTLNSSTDDFIGTPFASGGSGGTIYIPESLYNHLGDGTSSDYKAATNWSTVNGYGTITWAKIEGSQYENYYADGTPIPSS